MQYTGGSIKQGVSDSTHYTIQPVDIEQKEQVLISICSDPLRFFLFSIYCLYLNAKKILNTVVIVNIFFLTSCQINEL